MKRPALTLFSPLIIITITTVACDSLPDITDSGIHVVVAADPGLELCAGSLAHMDEFVARLSSHVSLAPPTGDDRFRFTWLDRVDFHDRSGCTKGSSGCAGGDHTRTMLAPHDHELAHNVSFALGLPPPLFVEGFAVAFEGLAAGYEADSASGSHIDIRELLHLSARNLLGLPGGYPAAGAFTAHLIERHGLEDYLRAYSELNWFHSRDAVDRVFRDVLGVSFEQSVLDFEATRDRCRHSAYDAKLLECSAPALEWKGDLLIEHRSLACDQDDAIGPFGGGQIVVLHTVEIAEAGAYTLVALGDGPGNAVSLRPCGGCDADDGYTVSAGSLSRTLTLAAGRHSLRLHGPAGGRTSVGFRLERVSDP